MPNSRRNRLRRWFIGKLPYWFTANPFQVFASILCFLGGLPLVLGEIESQSLESRLPELLIQAWGLSLVVGPIAVMFGMIKSWNQAKLSEFIFYGRIQAWGLSAIAYAAYIYGTIVIVFGQSGGVLPGLIIYILALTCHTEEVTIQLRIADIRLELGLNARSR